jgi:hypothetical protein
VGGIFSLAGVVIGGLFVLRTKRDGYEPLMPPLRDKETVAYNMDDFDKDQFNPDDYDPADSAIEQIFRERREEDPIAQANSRFKEQM